MTIVVNGIKHEVESKQISYEDVAKLAGFEGNKVRGLSMTWSAKKVGRGIMIAGDRVTLFEGISFSAHHTNRA